MFAMISSVVDSLLPASTARPAATSAAQLDHDFRYVDAMSHISPSGGRLSLEFRHEGERHHDRALQNEVDAFNQAMREHKTISRYLELRAELTRLEGEIESARKAVEAAEHRAATAGPGKAVAAARESQACREALTEAIRNANLIIGKMQFVDASNAYTACATARQSAIAAAAQKQFKAAEGEIIAALTLQAQRLSALYATRHAQFQFKFPPPAALLGPAPKLIAETDASEFDFQGRNNPLRGEVETIGGNLPTGPKH